MSLSAMYINWVKKKFPIVGTHYERLGILRVEIGGNSMYLTIPVFIIFHISFVVLLYQLVIKPIFGTPKFSWKDYVIIDRGRISRLSSVDKFNCRFCGYANGMVTMINCELDSIHDVNKKPGIFRSLIFFLVMIIYFPFIFIAEIVMIQIFYNIIIALPLKMKRYKIRNIAIGIKNKGYCADFNTPVRFFLRYYKNVFLRVSLLLEQIESMWCPLNHFEKREGIVYPKHHKRFFNAEDFEDMIKVLEAKGTVFEEK